MMIGTIRLCGLEGGKCNIGHEDNYDEGGGETKDDGKHNDTQGEGTVHGP